MKTNPWVLVVSLCVSCASEWDILGPTPIVRHPSVVQDLEPDWGWDPWVPEAPPAHDLLMVIDDSCSMFDDMFRLTSNIENLAGPLLSHGVDARIAITTTSCTSTGWCEPVQVVDSSPTMADDLAASLAWLDIGHGNDTEQGTLAMAQALTAPRQGWARRLPLDIVVITDESDSSPPAFMPPGGIDGVLSDEAVWRAGVHVDDRATEWVRVSAIVPLVEFGSCYVTGTGAYQELAARWAGSSHDLCTENWESVVSLVIPPDSVKIYLSRQPVVETIELHVNSIGVDVVMDDSAWTYDPVENSVYIEIGRPPEAWVEYEVAR